MERTPDSDEDQAAVEAAEWLILLQDEPENQNLRRRFEVWLANSPANECAWADLRHVSNVAAIGQPAYAKRWATFVARRRMEIPDPPARRPRGSRLRRGFAIAALAAAAACAVMIAAPGLILRIEADFFTRTAEQRQIELPDGSQVALAPASAIAVLYKVGERRIRLLSGEAFFEVQPDPQRPFRVLARTVEAAVLGTRFDVRLEPDDVTVSVEEGSVRVAAEDSPHGGERLGAGQSIRMTSGGTFSRTSAAPQLIGAWRQGQLYLQERRLGDAVAQLRRYFHGTILIVGDALAERRVTGAYDLTDPEHALRGMARAHDATVRRITPWLLVLSES